MVVCTCSTSVSSVSQSLTNKRKKKQKTKKQKKTKKNKQTNKQTNKQYMLAMHADSVQVFDYVLLLCHWIVDYIIMAKFRGGCVTRKIRVKSLFAQNEKSKLI